MLHNIPAFESLKNVVNSVPASLHKMASTTIEHLKMGGNFIIKGGEFLKEAYTFSGSIQELMKSLSQKALTSVGSGSIKMIQNSSKQKPSLAPAGHHLPPGVLAKQLMLTATSKTTFELRDEIKDEINNVETKQEMLREELKSKENSIKKIIDNEMGEGYYEASLGGIHPHQKANNFLKEMELDPDNKKNLRELADSYKRDLGVEKMYNNEIDSLRSQLNRIYNTKVTPAEKRLNEKVDQNVRKGGLKGGHVEKILTSIGCAEAIGEVEVETPSGKEYFNNLLDAIVNQYKSKSKTTTLLFEKKDLSPYKEQQLLDKGLKFQYVSDETLYDYDS